MEILFLAYCDTLLYKPKNAPIDKFVDLRTVLYAIIFLNIKL